MQEIVRNSNANQTSYDLTKYGALTSTLKHMADQRQLAGTKRSHLQIRDGLNYDEGEDAGGQE